MPGHRLVVVAASAGGVEALRTVLADLPADLPAAVLVVLHVPATGGRALPRILDRAGGLTADAAMDGEKLRAGRVYVAPPDRHMLVVDDSVRVSQGPRQNGHRPAADPLFRSVAQTAGARAIAVILSGTLHDGAVGCGAVERRGGTVVVQDPADSAYDGMPLAALAAAPSAMRLPLRDIGTFINRHCRISVTAADLPPDPGLDRAIEAYLAPRSGEATSGDTADLPCPDCGGPLHQQERAIPERYDCPVGHSWSSGSLLEGQTAAVEQSLWVTVRRLEERIRLTDTLAGAAEQRGHLVSAADFRATKAETMEALRKTRELLGDTGPVEIDRPGHADVG